MLSVMVLGLVAGAAGQTTPRVFDSSALGASRVFYNSLSRTASAKAPVFAFSASVSTH